MAIAAGVDFICLSFVKSAGTMGCKECVCVSGYERAHACPGGQCRRVDAHDARGCRTAALPAKPAKLVTTATHLPLSHGLADAIKNLKSYVESRASRRIEVVAKVGAAAGGGSCIALVVHPLCTAKCVQQGVAVASYRLCTAAACLLCIRSAKGAAGGLLSHRAANGCKAEPSLPAGQTELGAVLPPELGSHSATPQIESLDALPHLDEICEASDAVMVARSDLGAQVPFENVPSIQVGSAELTSGWQPLDRI